MSRQNHLGWNVAFYALDEAMHVEESVGHLMRLEVHPQAEFQTLQKTVSERRDRGQGCIYVPLQNSSIRSADRRPHKYRTLNRRRRTKQERNASIAGSVNMP